MEELQVWEGCCVGELRCGGVSVWGSCGVGSCGVSELQCVGVLVCGSYGVRELRGTNTNNKKDARIQHLQFENDAAP